MSDNDNQDTNNKPGLRPDSTGGHCNGNSIRCILKENTLVSLQNILHGDPLTAKIMKFLRCLKSLYSMCVKKVLQTNYVQVIAEYKASFLQLYNDERTHLQCTYV